MTLDQKLLPADSDLHWKGLKVSQMTEAELRTCVMEMARYIALLQKQSFVPFIREKGSRQ